MNHFVSYDLKWQGWFVVTRLGLRHDLRVWDIIALRFGEGTMLLTSVVAIFAFNRVVVLLGPRGAAAIVALVPVAATLFAIPVLGGWPSWPSGAAICIIALGAVLAAGSANQGNVNGESR